MILFTIGHSTRSIEEFISLLKNHKIEALVDVRAFPSSSKYPQFNKENLEASLFQAISNTIGLEKSSEDIEKNQRARETNL